MERELAVLSSRGLNVYACAQYAELPEDLRAALPAGYESLIVFGHGGTALWERLPHPLDPATDPIDRYTLDQVRWFCRTALKEHGPRILFPLAGSPLPLQRLGRFLNLARPSLLGLDIHPEFGVWFAYRCVLVTEAPVPSTHLAPIESACGTCSGRPCRSACPAGAVGASFDLTSCADYRLGRDSRCADRCVSRFACPYKPEHRYTEAQLRYHMGRPAHRRALADYGSGGR